MLSFRKAPEFSQAPLRAFHLSLRDKKRHPLPPRQLPVYMYPDFITKDEEASCVAYLRKQFADIEFGEGHLDKLIVDYREFYRTSEDMKQSCRTTADVAERCKATASTVLDGMVPMADRVHCLNISASGFVRPHFDDVRNSSGCVVGLTLLSPRVMTLTHPTEYPGVAVELLLLPRSLYVLCGSARYDWLHSIDYPRGEPIKTDGNEQETSAEASGVSVGQSSSSANDSKFGEGTLLNFDGVEGYGGLVRSERMAMIFRGVSGMELFMARMKAKEAATKGK